MYISDEWNLYGGRIRSIAAPHPKPVQIMYMQLLTLPPA